MSEEIPKPNQLEKAGFLSIITAYYCGNISNSAEPLREKLRGLMKCDDVLVQLINNPNVNIEDYGIACTIFNYYFNKTLNEAARLNDDHLPV